MGVSLKIEKLIYYKDKDFQFLHLFSKEKKDQKISTIISLTQMKLSFFK